MKSDYKVAWTDHALEELRRTFQYLELNFTDTEIDNLANKIESVLSYISTYPELYPESSIRVGVRRAVVTKFNSLFYRVNIERNQIEVLSFFLNRDNPEKLNL
jgi:plasmid stabilization system protein ParE